MGAVTAATICPAGMCNAPAAGSEGGAEKKLFLEASIMLTEVE